MDETNTSPARIAVIEYADRVLQFPNVIGCGVGKRTVRGRETGETALVVFVTRKLPLSALRADEILPREVQTREGPVVIDVVERAMPRLLADTATYRPLRGGCEISAAANSGAGTLGAVMYDGRDAEVVLLTANHVLTVAGQRTEIPANTVVSQPFFGGTVGRTKRIVPWFRRPLGAVDAVWEAQVDAGIVSLDPSTKAQFRVIDIGKHPYVPLPPSEGLQVNKRGRTTLLTTGTVKNVDVIMFMRDFNGELVRIGGAGSCFSIQSGPDDIFGAPGDSGSLVVDSAGGAARGLLFSADGMRGGWSYASSLISVMQALELETPCTGSLDAMFMRAFWRRQILSSRIGEVENAVSGAFSKNILTFRTAYFKGASEGSVGGALERMFQGLAHELSEALALDEDFAGLMDLALGDWLVQPTVFDMLEYKLPQDFEGRLGRAFDRLREFNPEARGYEWVASAFRGCGGVRMRDVLTRAAPAPTTKRPNVEPKPTPKRRAHR
jgi:hypothetical protein